MNCSVAYSKLVSIFPVQTIVLAAKEQIEIKGIFLKLAQANIDRSSGDKE